MRSTEAFYFFSIICKRAPRCARRASSEPQTKVTSWLDNKPCQSPLTRQNSVAYSFIDMEFFGTYGGHICGFGGFLTAIAALLYARARVAEFERSVADLDWQQVSELSLDVAKLKKAAQKWQNNSNAQEKVSQKDLLERALMERMMQQNSNVQQIRRMES